MPLKDKIIKTTLNSARAAGKYVGCIWNHIHLMKMFFLEGYSEKRNSNIIEKTNK